MGVVTDTGSYTSASPRVFHRFERPGYFDAGTMTLAMSPNAVQRDMRAARGDILFLQGWPGVQNAQELYRSLLRHDFSMCMPIWNGVGQRYFGDAVPMRGEVRFSESAHALDRLAEPWAAGSGEGAARVLGGYSLGSLVAPQLALAHQDSFDALFVIGGMFGAKDMFDNGVYAYKGVRGWDGWRAYMRDCMGPRCAVRTAGDPDVAFEDFRALVERGPEIGETIGRLDIPVAIVHSPSDTVFPYAHAQQYFPESAQVFPLETTHWLTDPGREASESRPGRFTEHTMEREIASLLSEFVREQLGR